MQQLCISSFAFSLAGKSNHHRTNNMSMKWQKNDGKQTNKQKYLNDAEINTQMLPFIYVDLISILLVYNLFPCFSKGRCARVRARSAWRKLTTGIKPTEIESKKIKRKNEVNRKWMMMEDTVWKENTHRTKM